MVGILLTIIFITGYLAIVMEHKIRMNKAAPALVAGSLTWTIFILFSAEKEKVTEAIGTHMTDISGILFFLIGAMTIVELIDLHDGFDIITRIIRTRNKRVMLWIISLITFFLSALLDNLTTTIVMVSIIRKLIHEERDRWPFAGIIIIAANAGGAWSPMGDVTTTMLWIGNQITAFSIILKLIVPSLVCLFVPMIFATFMIKPGLVSQVNKSNSRSNDISPFEKNLVFFTGMFALFSVPLFKSLTHLPPFMAMLLALGLMWGLTEIVHRNKHEKEKGPFSVVQALRRIDSSTILFFLGILSCISALQSSGILDNWAKYLMTNLSNQSITILAIGLLSAIVDNVPLVAAVQGMYPLSLYPTDHFFWEFLAYATGTGGSILIIGSAAGVAAMGMERITFFWFLKRISLLALSGYLAGAFTYILMF
ncbi:MAG TPA: sodium:proton antiporter NhaD [Bacteroidales bacterium]|nr:sodium:proton antiporter NhaD [Bacteroidales bacterium]